MKEEPIICSYIFTGKQHRRAMVCYWRHASVKWFCLACMLLILLSNVFGEIHSSSGHAAPSVTLLSVCEDFLPVLLLFLILFVVTLLLGTFNFRRSAYFNQKLTYAMSDSGMHAQSPIFDSEVKWAAYSRATESSLGFALFVKGGRSFAWLPKDGFSSAEAIKAGREFLVKNVENTKSLIG